MTLLVCCIGMAVVLTCMAGVAALTYIAEAARALRLTPEQIVGAAMLAVSLVMLATATRISMWAGSKLSARRAWRRVCRPFNRRREAAAARASALRIGAAAKRTYDREVGKAFLLDRAVPRANAQEHRT